MKGNYRLKFLSIICVVLTFLSSCNSGIDLGAIDDSSIKIDESLVLPIGEANLTVKDFLERLQLPNEIDTAATEIFFQWDFKNEMNLRTLNLVDSIDAFDKNIILANLASPILLIPANVLMPTIVVKDSFDLGLNGNVNQERVDSIKLNSSNIEISFDVSDDIKLQIPAKDFTIDFEFPNQRIVIENGILPTYTPVAYNQKGVISIGKYSMYMNGLKNLPYKINIRLTKAPLTNIVLSPTSFIRLNMKFSTIDFAVAYGLFNLKDGGRKLIEIPFKMEDYLPNTYLKFADPHVIVTATTNIGADLNFNAEYMSAYNSSNPSTKVWAWFDANRTIKSKTEKIIGPAKLGDWTTTSFQKFDAINGATDQLFDNIPYPDMLDYKFNISSDMSRLQNFVTPDSKVKLDLNVQLPFKIKGGCNYAFSDSIKNLNIGSLLDGVDSAILVLKIKNGLPLKAFYRMTFCKSTTINDTIPAVGGVISKISDDTSLGNLFSEYELKSPGVETDGTVIPDQIVQQPLKIMLNKTQIAALKQTQFIIFHVFLDTEKKLINGVETPNAVHLTTNNSFGVKLGVFVKGGFTTNIGTSN